MDRRDLVHGVYHRLQQEAADETRERVMQADEMSRRTAGRSQSDRELLLKLLRHG